MNDLIKITGARENNLKNINLEIPKNKIVVFTGLSGSGKSTLAFDTLYAEGQRRYMESLSSYARQFLDRVGKPDVDKIDGLTPAIAIDQKTTSKNPRSTVGTITEIYDYFRLLYTRIGVQHCHKCGKPISKMSASDIISEVLKLPQESKIIIYAPIAREKKGTFVDTFESLRAKGYVRAQIDGVMVRLDEEIELSKTKKHTIKVVIDRVVVNQENKERIAQDVERALGESYGELEVEISNAQEVGVEKKLIHYSEHMACFDCKISFTPLEPLSFSFNSPKGACPSCDGLGISFSLDLSKIINENLSIENGAIKIMYGFNKSYYYKFLCAFCEQNKINIKTPYAELSDDERRLILYGNVKDVSFTWKRHKLERKFEGVVKYAYDLLKGENDLDEYMSEKKCDACKGHRLRPESLAVKVAGLGLDEVVDMSIENCVKFYNDEAKFSYLSEQQKVVSLPILKEIKERLNFLYNVGLGYLTLGRDSRTISGGEAQRIRIASQIGSGLSGVMYVLDEPSIGLHERDTLKLIKTLEDLRDKGNTVIVVEHDKKTIERADFVVDIGPGAGKFGGEVVYAGDVEGLLKSDTQTAWYINGKKEINYAKARKQESWLEIKNVNINNISNLSAKFPLRNLVCITGVSGSGKSSLILQTLLPVAQEQLNRAKKIKKVAGANIEGLENLDKVIYLDQSPIGRTPRSNPATYTGVMDDIRNLFAQTKEAKIRGYKIGRFSFNVKGGRCEKCGGDGEIKIEMHFLPDINVVCDACHGARYNPQTLEVLYKSKNIADVLAMSVDEAMEFFKAVPKIYTKIKTMQDVGLGYVALGQNATTLSGGEAQRVKLAKELSKSDTGNTLYILDEPTTGLHFADVDKLVGVLHHLVELGNSVFVIEHNIDVIKNADYIVDMGPEGGSRGGKIIAVGSPKVLAKNYKKTGSFTGEFLALEFKSNK
ncbi:excinuclease ABC subunit UvrA [Campylobacter geochelonis]|uniref:excinuclease ABC subunit UvrA n=1 Tax=Campylobacter geochelonis TaxID=1780362 RepID=UPI0007708771|nr:excinuclease ABC subunit UvrA [Campylobacter geochelonis]CZE46805.1 excinuclease ABC subunit A [Campylobacter geochelonis]